MEEETQKRIEEMVRKRVEEELEKRKEEIEAEVLRRVEEAKRIMEHEMLAEMERHKQHQLEEMRRQEVSLRPLSFPSAVGPSFLKQTYQLISQIIKLLKLCDPFHVTASDDENIQ